MTYYERLKRKRLADILVDESIASREAVISALQEQQSNGRLLSDILLESREISEYELARALVEQFQAPFIDLRGYTFHKDLFAEFAPRLLHSARLVPLDRFGQQVCFACQEIPSDEVAAQLKEQSPGGMFFYVASSVEIRQCLKEHAPLSEEDLAEAKLAAAEKPTKSMTDDSDWAEIFDTANQSVIADLNADSKDDE